MAAIEIDEKDVLNPKDLEELYSWIDSFPLSRSKKNIARDFSDGVLVAEIIHRHLPRNVELHNYVTANNVNQKRINWSMINRKVFAKLNLKLSEKLIENVIEAKAGAIEQVLWDLRKKVTEMNPRPTLIRSVTGAQPTPTSTGYAEKKVPVVEVVQPPQANRESRAPVKGAKAAASPSAKSGKTYQGPAITKMRSPARANEAGKKGPAAEVNDISSYNAAYKDELSQIGADGKNGFLRGASDVNANSPESAALPPAHLIYKGHKMVPSMLLDIKIRQIRDLEVVVGQLQKKTNFLDNLISLKDNRVEDLTRQLHTLKLRFQELTHTRVPEL